MALIDDIFSTITKTGPRPVSEPGAPNEPLPLPWDPVPLPYVPIPDLELTHIDIDINRAANIAKDAYEYIENMEPIEYNLIHIDEVNIDFINNNKQEIIFMDFISIKYNISIQTSLKYEIKDLIYGSDVYDLYINIIDKPINVRI